MNSPVNTGILAAGVVFVFVQPAVTQEPETDEKNVLAVAEAALTAISNEDFLTFTDLMIDEAVLFSVSERDGDVRYSFRTRAEERGRRFERDIVERGFDARVQIAGHLATVWLPYDLYIDGTWSHCGVDIFSMIRLDGAWRIATLGWSVEQPPACREHPDGPPGS